jgi:WD40 repeat protein
MDDGTATPGTLMRLFPQSPGGTWRLAALAWLLLAAGAWWLLPPRPRATVTVPDRNFVLGVGIGGRTVVLCGGGGGSPGSVPDPLTPHVWDTERGTVRTVSSNNVFSSPQVLSWDGRWLAAGDDPPNVRRLRVIDLDTGDENELASPVRGPARFELASMSPDGRWLEVTEYEPKGDRTIRLWDLPARRPGPVIVAAAGPVVFSADGQRLAAWVWAADANPSTVAGVAVWETATGRELMRLPRADITAVKALTPDGRTLVLEESVRSEVAPTNHYVGLAVADRRVLWSVGDVHGFFPVDDSRKLLLYRRDDTNAVYRYFFVDAATGEKLGEFDLGNKENLSGAGPDGQTVLVFSQTPVGLNAMWWWLANHRLPGPKPAPPNHVDLLDTATGERLHSFPTGYTAYAPDGQSLAIIPQYQDGVVELWDVPPHKSLTWFAAVAAGLAVPLAALAWRRSRQSKCERRASSPPSEGPAAMNSAARADTGVSA